MRRFAVVAVVLLVGIALAPSAGAQACSPTCDDLTEGLADITFASSSDTPATPSSPSVPLDGTTATNTLLP